MTTPRPVDASVIIPAYNEANVIGRCLAALTAPGLPHLEIVVAVNGSTDGTADIARRHDGVTVLDLAEPSKAGALIAGDAAATAFPRIFLDADIELGPGALTHLIRVLTTDEAIVAAPAVRFDTTGCDAAVRSFYDAYRRTPYVSSGLVGLGVYGLSKAGRARFDTFPRLQADDLFVQRLFAPGERRASPGEFVVRAPRDLRSLIKVRTRIARGNAELASTSAEDIGATVDTADFSETTTSTMSALLEDVRRSPTHLLATLVYVGVVTAARLKARRDAAPVWHRDDSTR